MSEEKHEKRIQITRHKQKSKYFTENLGNGIGLEMVLIPGGTFLMGAPEDELERLEREGPQHEVTISQFFIGRYPVTQGQWKAVVETTEKIERDLNPDPSEFKDNYENYECWSRPVEQVSWYDAKEFCTRLSQKTKREYRLPTEAEWEYACRAGTTTPFHFGETITTDLANYRGKDRKNGKNRAIDSGSYKLGPKGEYRRQTTPVGYFKVANPFGLYDMHGLVWEWCEDNWHPNYEGAPNDGSAWLLERTSNTRTTKTLRGGSWNLDPRYCRSAFRNLDYPDYFNIVVGFRVACTFPKT